MSFDESTGNLGIGDNTPLNVTLEAKNLTMYYRNGSAVEAKLLDQNGQH